MSGDGGLGIERELRDGEVGRRLRRGGGDGMRDLVRLRYVGGGMLEMQ